MGDTTEESKQEFKLVIDKISDLLKKESLNYNDASSMKIEIESALKTFKDNIIKPTDKSKLQSAINKAQNLYKNSTEGTNDGEYKVESKALLLNVINDAKKVNENAKVEQKDIDSMVDTLKSSISKFENSKNKGFTPDIAVKYFVDAYGKIPGFVYVHKNELYEEAGLKYSYVYVGKPDSGAEIFKVYENRQIVDMQAW